ncbi:MAG: aminotransferase class I/II-fold pyridoxal phosphate-dependent enzyme, partial [Bacteroidales bacterium]
MKPRIYLSSPHMSGLERTYIDEAFAQNWIAPIGPNVDGFEQELAKKLGVAHVAAVSSGTAAIHLALINLGVQQGDEVIVSAFTFSASVNPIVYQGGVPVFVDSEADTWNMDPALLEEAIETRIRATGRKPKAIILVHIYGMPAKMELLMEIAERHGIPVIEDAAESLGGHYRGKATGTFGVMGVLSFNGNKIITTSGGGALLSDNEEFIRHARFLSTQARDNAPWYQHSHIGYNYRMSNIVAGIGRGQLLVLDQRVEARRKVYDWYRELFAGNDGIGFLPEPEGAFSNRWLTCITVDPQKTGGINHLDIMNKLAEDNIESRHIWKPMHLQPVFASSPAYI